ncbi:MAG: hypothetical protein Q9204_006218 [Flavoplaca sp. TL-2023a]
MLYQIAEYASQYTGLKLTSIVESAFSLTSSDPLFTSLEPRGIDKGLYQFRDIPYGLSFPEPGGTSLQNLPNVEAVKHLVNELNDDGIDSANIVVLCFYKGKVKLLREILPIDYNGNGKGCREICTVDEFAGREAKCVILNFVYAVKAESFDIQLYQGADISKCPKANEFVRDPGRINCALTRTNNHLFVIGQFASFVPWIFNGDNIKNTLSAMANDVFQRGLVLSQDEFFDPRSILQRDATGQLTQAIFDQYKVKRDAFIRQRLRYGRQRLGTQLD